MTTEIIKAANLGESEDFTQTMDWMTNPSTRSQPLRISLTASIYLVLALIWLPLPAFAPPPGAQKDSKDIHSGENRPIRTVFKIPPMQPLEQIVVRERHNKVPLPIDSIPADPHPQISFDSTRVTDMVVANTRDWDIFADPQPPSPTQKSDNWSAGEVIPPVITKRVEPCYPPLALKAGVGGSVHLQAILKADGTIDEIVVIRPLMEGKFGFEEKAIEALKAWEFKPGTLVGRPVDVRMTLTVSFRTQP